MTTPTLNAAPPIPADALCWRRAFPGRAEKADLVRRFVGFLLADSPHEHDAVQGTAEMAANAICHTLSAAPGGQLVVEVRRWAGGAAISVTDQGGPTDPKPTEPDYLAERGRGLHLIAATATWWGWRGDTTGRTVTAIYT